MSKKRVHEIAKEQGLSSKELLEKLQAAGVEAKAAASSVDEAAALKALGLSTDRPPATARPRSAGRREPTARRATPAPVASRHAATAPAPATPAPAPSQPASARRRRAPRPPLPPGSRPRRAGRATAAQPAPAPGCARRADARRQHAGVSAAGERVRPTRDSRTGERTPGDIGPGGRRRVVIDSQASRRQQGGPSNQPQRRPRRGRRRRGTYDETIAPIDSSAMEATDLIRVNSGSTVKDVAEYLGVPVPEVIKKLMIARRDGDAHPDALRRGDPGAGRRVRQADRDRPRRRRRRGRAGLRGRRGGPRRPSAGGHDHGPRRPRQDLAAGRDPRDRGGGRRGRRHHPAHRRLPGPPRAAKRSPSWTRRATRRSPRCARAARA